ncbi:MAG: NYN domain-containing protein [Clostridia bacterium]|nr:NYN domain-containing protein [Deltaproteobacteria bacterium]
MSGSTPKPRTPELGALITRVAEICDHAELAILLVAGLERQKLERLVARSKSASGQPFSQLSRESLAERAAASFGSDNADASFDILRELDRATENERAIVASMPEGDVTQQFVTDAALRIKRHGAQLVWAVMRDERLQVDEARDVLGRYLGTAAVIADEPSTVTLEERERVQWVAEAAKRETALKLEQTRTRELEARLSALSLQLAQRPAPDANDQNARRQDKRVAHLERQAAEADTLRARLTELERDNEQLKRTVASLRSTLAEKNNAPVVTVPPVTSAFASAETARAQIAEATSSAIVAALGGPLVSPPKRMTVPRDRQRIGVLVDVANVAGAARLLFERSVDYHRLLDVCRDGRMVVEAHAYVIDKGMPGVETFAAALRHGTYKVHIKRPKTFPDGSVKADWDLAIAVDAIGLAERCDVIVLASGDGDFVPLIHNLKKRRLSTEVVAFSERAAHELVAAVDLFTPLGRDILQP